MKKIIAFVLMLVLVFSMGVPSFAVTSDEQSTSLQSGWGSVTSAPSYPTGYYSSWFYRIAHNLFNIYDIQSDLKSGWSDTLTPTGFSGSFYSVIRNSLKTINTNLDYIEVDIEGIYSLLSSLFLDVAEIKTDVSLNLGSIDSSLISLLDIVPDIDSIASSAVSIKTFSSSSASSLSSIDSTFDTVYDFLSISLDSYLSNQALFLSSISDDVSMLQQVLADEEDLALKESQKENQQFIQDTFFNPGSALSLDVSKLTDFTKQFTDFTDSFNFIEEFGTSTSPLESISEGSDFSQWFTTETGQDMDPTFGGDSGGGGGEDPDPEPEPEPIKNWLPLATTEPGGTEIYNGIGYLPGYRWSGSVGGLVSSSSDGVSGYIPCVGGDTLYFLNFRYVSSVIMFYDDNGNSLLNYVNSSPDDNGVVSFSVPNISNIQYFRISFGLSSDSLYFISINEYPIQTASTFSLRAQSVLYEPEVVTSYYADRMAEYYSMLGGR